MLSCPRSTTMQERLSFEPAFRAFRQTAAAASPGSGQGPPLRRHSATRATTSRLGKSPSEIPSQTSITKSAESHSRLTISGTAETGWSDVSGSPTCLYCASPNARLTANSPLTRDTPMTCSTVPPTRRMRVRSEGWSGLWSVVMPPSVPWPSTSVPSARPSSTRLSPTLPTRRWYFPPGVLGGVMNANVPVEPLGWPVARNSLSRRSASAEIASSSSGAPQLSSSSVRRRATKVEHWLPPWPSKTPKKPQLSRMWTTCESSMVMRHPFISATPTRMHFPAQRRSAMEVTALGNP
mmetsp:Transcript_20946/g.62470  ORF Transcript_20946/g.62470 Transcript_20946/m.62470 type:complete len:294 (-) Transcript_20946:76-957(-)